MACEPCVAGRGSIRTQSSARLVPPCHGPCPTPLSSSRGSFHPLRRACFERRTGVARTMDLRDAAGRKRSCVVYAQGWNPPTVSDTKAKFYQGYRKPVPSIYNTVVQELLVQQHLIRYNKNYRYDPVFGLGFVSTFDQVLDGLPVEEQTNVFDAYIRALDEDPNKYRGDAQRLETWAKGLGSSEGLVPNASGDDIQRELAGIAAAGKEGKFFYSKFFAIGLFRLLELTGAKDPKALEALVTALNVPASAVNRDLLTYKNVLSKLAAAKELMREVFERGEAENTGAGS
eukprot:jgi/Botrbrau1/3207/Bobra.37_2s0037.1